MRRLLPRGYLFTVLGIAVGVSGLVALGAMAERISRFIEGGDRFVLGQISVAGEGMGMGTGFTAGGLLRAAKIEQIAQVPGVAAVQAQVMLPLNPTTSQFLTLTQELVLGIDPATPMPNRQFRELPVKSGRIDELNAARRETERDPRLHVDAERGGALGVGLALAIGTLVDARVLRDGQQLFLFSPRLLIFAIAFSVILGGLAATYATLRIVRLSPAEAIRRGT